MSNRTFSKNERAYIEAHKHDIEDRGAQRQSLQGVIQVCHNFSVPISNVYEGLRSIGNFDPEEPIVKKAKKRPSRLASKSLGTNPLPT